FHFEPPSLVQIIQSPRRRAQAALAAARGRARLGAFEVDRQIDPGRELDRQIARFGALENPVDVAEINGLGGSEIDYKGEPRRDFDRQIGGVWTLLGFVSP